MPKGDISMPNVPRCVDEFIAYMRVIKNRTKETTIKYEHDLCMFLRYVYAARQGIKPGTEEYDSLNIRGLGEDFVKTITSEEILSFLYHKKTDDHNESRAIARRLSSIRSFFRYYTGVKHILDENPAADLDTPPQKTMLPRFLSLDESIELLEAVRTDTQSKTRERDYAIIVLFLNCGMRLSELTGIKISDMDPKLRSLRVMGKGAKERIIYLNDACREALTDYLRIRAADPDIKPEYADYLFISSHHRRIDNSTVQKLVYKYLRMAGLGGEHYSVHKLRHTAATLMYRSGGVDVRVLKDILGHEQLNTTQIYTHVSDSQMEKAMDANPLASVGKRIAGKRTVNSGEDTD